MFAQMVLVVPFLVVFYGSMIGIGIAVASNERVGLIVAAIVVPLVMLFLMTVSLLLSTAMVPLYLGRTASFFAARDSKSSHSTSGSCRTTSSRCGRSCAI